MKKVMFFVVVSVAYFFAPVHLNAQNCTEGDCMNGHGTYVYANGGIYEGEFKNGLRDGQGTFTWTNADKYTGEYKKGLRNGQGSYFFANGETYVGAWKKDKKNGQGTYYFADGTKYVGVWKNGEKMVSDKKPAEVKETEIPEEKEAVKEKDAVKEKQAMKEKEPAREKKIKKEKQKKIKKEKEIIKNNEIPAVTYSQKVLVNVDEKCQWKSAMAGTPATIVYTIPGPDASTVQIEGVILGVSNSEKGLAKSLVVGSNDSKILDVSGATINEVISKRNSVQLKISKADIVIVKTFDPSQISSSFTDTRDGKEYKTIKIGTQTWMADNLDYESPDSWCNLCLPYGRLYTYEDAIKACPSGWRLPDETEWKTLSDFLGGENVAGGKMKEAGTEHWSKPNSSANNVSGFNALPGGGFSTKAKFSNNGNYGYWWTTKDFDYFYSLCVRLSFDSAAITFEKQLKVNGISVRCIKD